MISRPREHGGRSLERRARGKLHVDPDDALVPLGNESGRDRRPKSPAPRATTRTIRIVSTARRTSSRATPM